MKFKLLGILGFLFLLLSTTQAQVGNRYFWADTLNITTTERDTTFDSEWEEVTMYADSVDTWIKIGAPDVTSWSARNWIFLPAGVSITIGPRPRLKRLSVKTVSAGSGIFNLLGYKTTAQY